jgi:hypothetical protein
VTISGDHGVAPLDKRSGATRRSGQVDVSELLQQLCAGCSAGRDAADRPDEMPGREPLFLGQRLEQRRGVVVGERQEGEVSASIGCCDGTRRETAEPSAAVVEHDGSEQHGHGPILPGDGRPRLAACRT